MAEPVGLTIGAMSLAGLFSTCLDFMDIVTLERNYGRDFEVCLAKIALLNCRLNVWGGSLRIRQRGQESEMLREQWPQLGPAIGQSLMAMKDVFEDQERLKSQYGLRAIPAEQTIAYGANVETGGIQEVERSFKILSRRRQKGTSLQKRLWWAVHDKKKFDDLISDMNFFVTSLEKVSDRLLTPDVQQDQRETFQEYTSEVQSASGQALLRDAENSSTPAVEVSEDQQTSSDGHAYLRMLIAQEGRAINGNVDYSSGLRNRYTDGVVLGKGKAINGDVSGAAMESFFR